MRRREGGRGRIRSDISHRMRNIAANLLHPARRGASDDKRISLIEERLWASAGLEVWPVARDQRREGIRSEGLGAAVVFCQFDDLMHEHIEPFQRYSLPFQATQHGRALAIEKGDVGEINTEAGAGLLASSSLQMLSNSSASARVRLPSTLSLGVDPRLTSKCVMRVRHEYRLLNFTLSSRYLAVKSYAELFHAASQGGDGQAEDLCRPASASYPASGVPQDFLDVRPLHLFHRNEPGGRCIHSGTAVGSGFSFQFGERDLRDVSRP